ncbi:MAG TPA: DNA replication and repair protein RecF, partial [Chitinophagales bacterium]|nr:DNA replication and repair protein RecF [Chitinophagales bacterium]
LLKTQKQLTPLLLLDDIFDKLDIHRIAKIIQLVNKDSIGQVFISDTDKNRIQHFINENNITPVASISLFSILS